MTQCKKCLALLDTEWCCPQCSYIPLPSTWWPIGTLAAFALISQFSFFHIAISALFIFSAFSIGKKTILLIGNEERKKRKWNLSVNEYNKLQEQLFDQPNHPGYKETAQKTAIYEGKLLEQQIQRARHWRKHTPAFKEKMYTLTCDHPALYKQVQEIFEAESNARIST